MMKLTVSNARKQICMFMRRWDDHDLARLAGVSLEVIAYLKIGAGQRPAREDVDKVVEVLAFTGNTALHVKDLVNVIYTGEPMHLLSRPKAIGVSDRILSRSRPT